MVLLMRIEGPMQSFGYNSFFQNRETLSEPTKSSMIGLLCSAIGIDRKDNKNLIPLTKMRMGVRVDCPGDLNIDFQTIGSGDIYYNWDKYNGYYNNNKEYYIFNSDETVSKNAVISKRYYLSDASFIVGFESVDESLLRECHNSLKNPKWHLFLGRKSYVPTSRIYLPDGLKPCDLETALLEYEYSPFGLTKKPKGPLKFIIENDEGTPIKDNPISFHDRVFSYRYVNRYYKEII